MIGMLHRVLTVGALLALVGCTYTWTPTVPDRKRTVAVPTFVSSIYYTEMGATMTRYTLREFQKEGTFKIKRAGESAIELQGEITRMDTRSIKFERSVGMDPQDYRIEVGVKVTAVDKHDGTVLYTREYSGGTIITVRSDLPGALHDAAPRISQEIARQIVDDLVSFWDGPRERIYEQPIPDEMDERFKMLAYPDETK